MRRGKAEQRLANHTGKGAVRQLSGFDFHHQLTLDQIPDAAVIASGSAHLWLGHTNTSASESQSK